MGLGALSAASPSIGGGARLWQMGRSADPLRAWPRLRAGDATRAAVPTVDAIRRGCMGASVRGSGGRRLRLGRWDGLGRRRRRVGPVGQLAAQERGRGVDAEPPRRDLGCGRCGDPHLLARPECPGGLPRRCAPRHVTRVELLSEHESYRWLNTSFIVGEGEIDEETEEWWVQAYVCVNEVVHHPPALGAPAPKRFRQADR